ncbi:NAD(P)/FAD-dependent oxidoreductase [Cryptosporangium sp. NPDC051539]|uniref:NAD(P)/FAD-dependent oxidoreductase n=1 Tax=Cryptosporangium sp. NPDC051539 TaxID=3363962 RepID=UPI003789C621
MPSAKSYDVVVVGAGPGGSTTASFLAKAGLSVLVVEGKRFPRWHIGESLLAMSLPIFTELGLLPDLQRFQRKLGALWVWGPALSLIRLDMPNPGYAFQVQRAEFDTLLMNTARAAGADVAEECWAREPIWDAAGRMCGLRVQNADGATSEVSARYVVDASGLFQFLPRQLGLPMDLFGPQRAAVTAYWRGAARPSDPYGGDVISEACADGWLWFIPFADGQVGVGFVGDAVDVTRDTEGVLARQIASSVMIKRLLDGAERAHQPRLLKYTNHIVRSPMWDRGYVLVGDTAGFVDPLFSTGIHATVYSSSLAAAGIASVLAGDLADEDAAAWYDRRVRGHYRRTTEMTRLLYAAYPGSSRFWRARSMADIDEPAAERLLSAIGAGSIALISRAVADGALHLPDAISRLLPGFSFSLPRTALPPDTVLSLADEVSVRPDWTRRGTTVVPAVLVSHRRQRAPELDFPIGSSGHRLIQAIDGRRSLGALLAECADDDKERRVLELTVGGLVSAGILTGATRPAALAGADHA